MSARSSDRPHASVEAPRTPEIPPEAGSPMIAQYLAIKREHADCLLFYRMGDFYELFFDDAQKAAAALDITLTKRGRYEGQDIPMCGVPIRTYETYLARLTRKGFRVAVCEQVEDPAEAKKRGSKAVVKREVVRVVTAGTLTEDTLLDARSHNYLAAMAETQGMVGLAWLDISTGEFQVQASLRAHLGAALARLDPAELLVSDKMLGEPALFEVMGAHKERLTPLPASRFDVENSRRRLEALYEVKALDAFGGFTPAELAAAGALVDYVELTQKGRLPRLSPLRRLAEGAILEIDPATRRNLELTQSLSFERQGSLLAVIDRTITGPGARLLAAHLGAPLTEPEAILRRLDMLGFFLDDAALRGELRQSLRRCPDLERALQRLSLGRGGPRDLAAIRDGLSAAAAIRRRLPESAPEGILDCRRDLGFHDELAERLGRALKDELPHLARDGNFIADGYSEALAELRGLGGEARRLVANLQARYISETSVATLRIGHNNIIGYHVEVPAKQADRLGTDFIHRQTMSNAARYTTLELNELEKRIANAGGRCLALELQLFEDLVGEVRGRGADIAATGLALAGLDVALGLAEQAAERNYCRPSLDRSLAFDIRGGRHPVVEAALTAANDCPFAANDCDLSEDRRLWLLTGPNMAGKSTFLRQNAVILVLAQMGSYVPAASAHIGVADRLFSRVGAADDLARGRSTFMVEMVETAAILNQAGPRSLVILDEIGRGTATFDGLSLAWAVVEHLHEATRCRGLFATHYHELTQLNARLAALSCHFMRVKEWKGRVVFLHEVASGNAERSYGIHVARLAGLPASVLKRAEEVLRSLEKDDRSGFVTELPLFAAALARSEPPPAPALPSAVEAALADIEPDELTPRQALDALYRLKGLER